MCIITYNYISEPNQVILQPIHILNDNLSNTEINGSYVQLVNVSYSKDIISGPVDLNASVTEQHDDEINDESTPHALEFRLSQHEVSNNNRRQIKTERKSPRPFIYENRDPIPTGFITPVSQIDNQKYPQTQTQVRNKAKNIQEIIKYLTEHQPIHESIEDVDNSKKRIKKRPRGENYNKNLKKGKGTSNIFTYAADPFFPYKPQNPSDVNLLATNSFRFAPTIQVEPKKPKKTTVPKHEQSQLINNVPNRLAGIAPVNLNVDTYPTGNDKKVKKRKNHHSRPVQYNNYGSEYNNPYNQNNFYNQGGRFPPNRINYWNRFRNNEIVYNKNKIKNDLLQENEVNNPSQMVVHLNLYPKKKRQNGENRHIEIHKDEFYQNNCTDILEEPTDNDNHLAQIKNATEFNQLLQNIKFSYVNHKEEEEDVPNNNSDDMFQINDTILKLNEPLAANGFKNIRNNHNLNGHNPQDIEVLNSIGFTVLNSNFTKAEPNSDKHYTNSNNNDNQAQWYPMIVNNNAYSNDQVPEMSGNTEHVTGRENNHKPELNIDLVIKGTTDNYNEFSDETVTLPLPTDIFEKYFNKKSPLKSNADWDADMLLHNPNLINHKAHFSD